MKTILSMVANWRTSASALAGLPVALGAAFTLTGTALTSQFDNDPATVANWSAVGVVWGVLWSLAGNLFARDAVVTSEESGAE